MAKFFLTLKQYSFVFITFCILLTFFSYYFLIYVPQKEKLIIERGFRILRNISQNILDKHKNNLESAKYTVSRFIKFYEFKNFNEDLEISTAEVVDMDSILKTQKPIDWAKYPYPQVEIEEYAADKKIIYTDTVKILGEIRENYNIYQYSLKISIKKMLKPFLNDFFDDYCVLSKEEKNITPIYQSELPCFSEADTDTLTKFKKNVKDLWIKNMNLGGIDYKVFSYHFSFSKEMTWTVCGLMKQSSFVTEKWNFPKRSFFVFLLLFTLFLLLLPFLKFLLINTHERIHLQDLYTNILLLIFFPILLLILLLGLAKFSWLGDNYKDRDKQLKSLTTTIQSRFKKEITEIEKELDKLDSQCVQVVSTSLLSDNCKNINRSNPIADTLIKVKNPEIFNIVNLRISAAVKNTTEPFTADTLIKVKNPEIFNIVNLSSDSIRFEYLDKICFPYKKNLNIRNGQISWIDKSGKQKIKWTSATANRPPVDVSERFFFQQLKNNEAWILEDTLAIESIITYNAGSFQVVVAKKSKLIDKIKNNMVDPPPPGNNPPLQKGDTIKQEKKEKKKEKTTIEITAQLRDFKLKDIKLIANVTVLNSVMESVLPRGFGFCIFDESGKAWFHSDKERSLRENFLEECNDNPEIKAAQFARSANHLDITYQGNEYRGYIQPLDKFPLYILTFADKKTLDGLSNQITSITLIELFFYFLLLLANLLLISALNSRESKLKIKTYHFSWLLPQKINEDKYVFATVFNLLLAFFLFGIYFLLASHQLLFLHYFIVPLLVIAGLFIVLNDSYKKIWIYILPSLLFLILGYFVFYIDLSQKTALSLVIVFPFIANIFRLKIWKQNKTESEEPKQSPSKLPSNYINKYSLFILSLVFVLCILPAYIFYKINYEEEMHKQIKYTQIQLAKDKREKEIELRKSIKEAYRREKVLDSALYSDFYYETKPSIDKIDYPPNDDKYLLLYNDYISRFRFFYNQYLRDNHNLLLAQSTDLNILSTNKRDRLVTQINQIQDTKSTELSSQIPSFLGWNVGFILLLIPVLLFPLFRFILKRIFGITLLENEENYPKFFQRNHLLIDRSKAYWEYLKNKAENNNSIEFIEFDLLTDGREKLEKIKDLINNKKNLLLFTTDTFYYKGDNVHHQALARNYKLLLEANKFNIFENPSTGINNVSKSIDKEENIVKEELLFAILGSQTKMQGPSPSNSKKQDETKKNSTKTHEVLVLSIEEYLHNYYCKLWNSCTTEEKLALYDLAQDDLINYKNRAVFRKLCRKGLLLYEDGRLKMLNKSFHHFVLQIIQPKHAYGLENSLDEQSTWDILRTPILLVISSFAFFVMLTQEEIFNKIIAFIGSFVAALPIIFKLINIYLLGTLPKNSAD